MSVTVKDFLDSARPLVESDVEIGYRNAISRAYYSAFLWARSYVESCNTIPHDVIIKGSHDEVITRYLHHGDTSGKSIAYQLTAFKRRRCIADYDLDSSIAKREAVSAIADAEKIIERVCNFHGVQSPLFDADLGEDQGAG